MRSCVKINGEKDKIIIKLKDEATQEEIMESLKKKITDLKKLYKDRKSVV